MYVVIVIVGAVRCFGLNEWIGLVFLNYKSRSVKAQNVIESFLGINKTDSKHKIALEVLLGQATPLSIQSALSTVPTANDATDATDSTDAAVAKSGTVC